MVNIVIGKSEFLAFINMPCYRFILLYFTAVTHWHPAFLVVLYEIFLSFRAKSHHFLMAGLHPHTKTSNVSFCVRAVKKHSTHGFDQSCWPIKCATSSLSHYTALPLMWSVTPYICSIYYWMPLSLIILKISCGVSSHQKKLSYRTIQESGSSRFDLLWIRKRNPHLLITFSAQVP